MENFPAYIGWFFGITTFLTIFIFYKATGNSRTALFVILGWLLLQAIVGLSGFYTVTDTVPPRFFLLLLPPVVFIILLFTVKKGLHFMDRMDLKMLTLLHVVRIPVEVVLLWLFINKAVPQLMTFEGKKL